jgi:hypothetical protein
VNRIRPFYRNLFTAKGKEPVDEALVRCHISLLHRLLNLPSAKAAVLSQLKALIQEDSLGSKYAVLDIINDERGLIREGDLVYNREDGLKEPLLVLGSHQGFKVKAYLRDILYYRYDIKERKDHWALKEETHSDCKQLTVNLRTGNYGFVHPDFLTRVAKESEPAHIAWLIKELQLEQIRLAQADPASLLLAYKLFKVLKSAKDRSAKETAKASSRRWDCRPPSSTGMPRRLRTKSTSISTASQRLRSARSLKGLLQQRSRALSDAQAEDAAAGQVDSQTPACAAQVRAHRLQYLLRG